MRFMRITALMLPLWVFAGCGPQEIGTNDPKANLPSQDVIIDDQPDEKVAEVAFPDAQTADTEQFSIAIPRGWIRARIDRSKTKLMLVYGHQEGREPVGMLKVDAGLPSESSAEATVAALARDFGADPKVVSTQLGGQEAFQVSIPGEGLQAPQHAIAAIRNGRLFLLMIASDGSIDTASAIEHVRGSWKWSDDE